MRNLLQKKLNKKGFTLAELLIVVAIIAILVAVAMPLFFGALDKAEKAVYDANRRSLKAAGVADILSKYGTDDAIEAGTNGWSVIGTFDADGNLKDATVAKADSEPDETDFDEWKEDKTSLVIGLTETELK